MSDAELLLALAERCEREEPSPALDVRIFLALNDPDVLVIDDRTGRFPRPSSKVKARSIWNDAWPLWADPSQVEGVVRELSCPAYTSSLDAAVTLAPAGFRFVVDNLFDPLAGAISEHGDISGHSPAAADGPKAKTPALALCAAALRARAHEADVAAKNLAHRQAPPI